MKASKFTIRLSKDEVRKAEKAASRKAQIEAGIPNFAHKVHKSAKQYNRKREKMVNFID